MSSIILTELNLYYSRKPKEYNLITKYQSIRPQIKLTQSDDTLDDPGYKINITIVCTERMMIKWMCRVTLEERCKSEELRKHLEIEDVADVVRKSRLVWFGHLERKDAGVWVSACRNIDIVGNVGKS